jgi:two-component system, NtrC family, response regulator AtoC
MSGPWIIGLVSDLPDATLTLAGPESASGSGAAHLLVVEGASSALFPLPRDGVVVIGRAPECDLKIVDAACSRRHATLHIAAGEVTLEDLGSHNGTRVNGERMQGTRPLAGDDVISIGPVKLVLHAALEQPAPSLLDPRQLRERLTQEVERTISYERPLSVAVGVIDPDAAPRVRAELRLIDVLGKLDGRSLVVVMPELHPDAARAAAARLASSFATTVGLAHCPSDGHRGDVLLAAARAAASLPGGGVHEASECITTLQLDGATALVADPAMMQVYDLLRRLAQSELTVLIHGETGSGKENAARAVHLWSSRMKGPFVAINCASLPETLIESELFGYEKGAFSGAAGAKPGRMEAASGGTVFFDEVGELPLSAQAKLLRALETRRATRLGAVKEYALDVRIVAATHRDLPSEVKAGRFREDLYFRLSGARVMLPPLRDRPRELALLARLFLERASTGRPAPALSAPTLAALARHRWPGNVRELKNEMEYVAATASDDVVEPWHLSERLAATPLAGAPSIDQPAARMVARPVADELRELERRRMVEALAAAGGVQKRAAELIGMPVRTFTMKYKQYGLGDK